MQWARRNWASVLVWVAWLGSAAGSSAQAAPPEPHRVLVLTPFDNEALARLRGQTVDLAWELIPVADRAERAARACDDADADAALWLTTDDDGALRLWLFEAASGNAEARSFPLAAPGDRGAQSAQREALAVSTRARLKALGARLQDIALPVSAPATRQPRAPAPQPRRIAPPEEPAVQAEPPVPSDPPPPEPTTPPPSDDEGRADREPVPPATDGPADDAKGAATDAPTSEFGLALGWAGVRISPLPVQHGPALEVSVAWPGAWLRASLGFQQALTVDDAFADTRLRIGRRRLGAGLAIPIPLTDRWRLAPNLETAWLRVTRRTRQTEARLAGTTRAKHDLVSLRPALDVEARIWRRCPFSLWVFLSAGAEITPSRLVWRVTAESQDTDRALDRAGPSLRFGVRGIWMGTPVTP